MGSIPSSDSRVPPAARPSLRLSPRGRSDPAFRGSWSPSRRHPSERHVQWTVTSTTAPPPGFLTLSAVSSHARASWPSAPRLRGVLRRSRSALARLPRAIDATAVQDLPYRGPFKVPPAGIACPFRDRWLPRRSGWRRVQVRSFTALRPIACPDLPGFLPTPTAFRPTLTKAPRLLSCVLVCGRPRRGGRSWSRARATFHQRRNAGLLVTRRHGEPCSPSRRSVDLGAFFLPRARRPSSGFSPVSVGASASLDRTA